MTDVFDMAPQPSLIGKRPLPPDFHPSEINGAFFGLDDELARAPYRAALSLSAGVNLLAAPLVGALGQEAQDRWFASMVDAPLRTLEELNERSAINGTGARVIGELGRIALEAPLGPVGLGTAEALSRTGLELRKGKTAPEATALGAVTGATMAVGFALPMTLPVQPGWGPALLQRLGFGVGSNVVLGTAQRGAEKALGEDVAVMDKLALTLDAALGAFFGGVAHLASRPTREAADAAMVMIEQASAQRVVPPGEPPQGPLNHLAAKQQDADLPDPPVPSSAARVIEDAALADEAALREAEPALVALEQPGAGEPLPLPRAEAVAEQPAPKADAAKAAPEAEAWSPVNTDGETVPMELAAIQQAAAQLDAIGATINGRKASEILADAVKAHGDADALLARVTQCILSYGN